jgi:asparagine synthase (glutamine-hydrolysing)
MAEHIDRRAQLRGHNGHMSAIAGIWRITGGPEAAESCERMLSAQSIYGRYKSNVWSEGPVALGRRLAKLLPEDVYDDQPLIGACGRYVLVADLRLDNRDELIAALAISAAQAKTMCDAALLLAAIERCGADCCERLIGDYAFALWDAAERCLVLARDFLGSRPLHYFRGSGFVAIASMPKGLHALYEIPRAPNEERLAEFLTLMPESGSATFFEHIEKVETGSIVTIDASGVRTRRHWQWSGRKLALSRSEDYVEGLRHHLDQAVRCRLRGANGAVAAHLSAGFDSSSVAATAARLLAPSGGKVVAFTAVPHAGYDLPVPKYKIGDEGPLAALTAAMYPNIEHVLVRSGHRSPLDELDRSFFLYDRPLLNICNNVWGSAIADEARRRELTVLLTGQLGNMTLSYDGGELLAELVRAGQWIQWGRAAAAIVRARHRRLRGVMAASVGPWLPPRLWLWFTRIFHGYNYEINRYSAIDPARLAELDLPARARGLDFSHRPRKDGVAMRLLVLGRVDLGNYTIGALGGWGLDMRDPTADRRLVEFCLSVPTEEFYKNGVARALAKRVLADRLPAEVLGAKARGLQAIDWHEGLTAARPQLAEEVSRLEQIAPAERALDLKRMRRLVENWPSEGWHRPEVSAAYRIALLRGISTGHFIRRASGANA